MIRRVYDEPNPFMPEIKRKRENPANKPSSSNNTRQFKSRAIPPEQRWRFEKYLKNIFLVNYFVLYVLSG